MSKKWMSYTSGDLNARTTDQFDFYPDKPGYKREGTSKQAAEEVAPEVSALQLECLRVIKEHPVSADIVAHILGKSILTIRPRLSELVAKGKIVESGERRRNASGKWAIVWKAI